MLARELEINADGAAGELAEFIGKLGAAAEQEAGLFVIELMGGEDGQKVFMAGEGESLHPAPGRLLVGLDEEGFPGFRES